MFRRKKAQIEAEIPAGLPRAVAGILARCVGKENAMSRDRLLYFVRQNPIYAQVGDRTLRAAIAELRKNGQALICSAGGSDGGYWLARDWEELEDFLAAELESRATDLFTTASSMRKAAHQFLGDKPAGRQERLF